MARFQIGRQLIMAFNVPDCLIRTFDVLLALHYIDHHQNVDCWRAPPISAGWAWSLNIEFKHGFGGKLRWLIRLQTGI